MTEQEAAELNQLIRSGHSYDASEQKALHENMEARALSLSDKSPSNKYVIVRRTVTVVSAMPVEHYGHGGTEKHSRKQMQDHEIVNFEMAQDKETMAQSTMEQVEYCRSEDLIDVTTDVRFAVKGPGE